MPGACRSRGGIKPTHQADGRLVRIEILADRLRPVLAEEVIIFRAVEIELAERQVKPPILELLHRAPDAIARPDDFHGMRESARRFVQDSPAGGHLRIHRRAGTVKPNVAQFVRQQNPARLIGLLQMPAGQGVHRHIHQHRVQHELRIGIGAEQPLPRQHANLALDAFFAVTVERHHALEKLAVEQVFVKHIQGNPAGPFSGERKILHRRRGRIAVGHLHRRHRREVAFVVRAGPARSPDRKSAFPSRRIGRRFASTRAVSSIGVRKVFIEHQPFRQLHIANGRDDQTPARAKVAASAIISRLNVIGTTGWPLRSGWT